MDTAAKQQSDNVTKDNLLLKASPGQQKPPVVSSIRTAGAPCRHCISWEASQASALQRPPNTPTTPPILPPQPSTSMQGSYCQRCSARTWCSARCSCPGAGRRRPGLRACRGSSRPSRTRPAAAAPPPPSCPGADHVMLCSQLFDCIPAWRSQAFAAPPPPTLPWAEPWVLLSRSYW